MAMQSVLCWHDRSYPDSWMSTQIPPSPPSPAALPLLAPAPLPPPLPLLSSRPLAPALPLLPSTPLPPPLPPLAPALVAPLCSSVLEGLKTLPAQPTKRRDARRNADSTVPGRRGMGRSNASGVPTRSGPRTRRILSDRGTRCATIGRRDQGSTDADRQRSPRRIWAPRPPAGPAQPPSLRWSPRRFQGARGPQRNLDSAPGSGSSRSLY